MLMNQPLFIRSMRCLPGTVGIALYAIPLQRVEKGNALKYLVGANGLSGVDQAVKVRRSGVKCLHVWIDDQNLDAVTFEMKYTEKRGSAARGWRVGNSTRPPRKRKGGNPVAYCQ